MLEVRCFGRVGVFDEDGTERQVRSRKHAGLLLYLVAHPRTTHPREDLADLLWDGAGPRERHSLSQGLYDIRSNVGSFLDVTTTTVRLLPDRTRYEADLFEQAVETRDHDTALDLYRGEFAPELVGLEAEMFDRWVDGERERCRVLASLALRNAQRAAEERGDWDRLCLASLRLVRMNEFDEEAHCALMRGLWMKGDPASALRHYRQLDPDLTRDWKTARDLARRMDRSGSVREVLTVPREPLRLVGREAEFLNLQAMVTDPRSRGRIVFLTGERGIGKSALIRELARVLEARGVRVTWASPSTRHELQFTARPHGQETLSVQIVDSSDSDLDLPAVDQRTVRLVSRRSDPLVRPSPHSTRSREVHLERLLPRHLHAIVRHEAQLTYPDAAAVADLTDGNPGLALSLCNTRIWHRPQSRSDAVGIALAALSDSAQLRALVQAWIDDLSPEERSVAAVLCVLTEEARVFGSKIGDAVSPVGLRRLSVRGWLRQDFACLAVSPQIVAIALADQVAQPDEVSFHRQAIRCLIDGTSQEKLAAVMELLAIGEPRKAMAVAYDTAKVALRGGNARVASRAAWRAFGEVETVRDRLQLGFLAAEADLLRGRASRAEDVARRMSDLARTPEDQFRARLIVVRALHASGSYEEALRELHVARGLSDCVEDEASQWLIDAERATIGLSLAEEGADLRAAVQRARELETVLRLGEAMGRVDSAQWLQALRSLFSYRIVHDGYSCAEAVMERIRHLRTESVERWYLTRMFRSAVELRAGRVHGAVAASTGILARSEDRAELVTAAARNNLGVAYMELGEFERAKREFAAVEDLDSSIQPSIGARLNSLLNLTQALWFGGHLEEGRQAADRVRSLAATASMPHVEAMGVALAGLLALSSEPEKAQRLHHRLTELGDATRATQEDQYLIHWFRAAMAGRKGASPHESLVEAATAIEPMDRLASAKLALVSASYGSGTETHPEQVEALRRLRRAGVGWFPRFLAKYYARH